MRKGGGRFAGEAFKNVERTILVSAFDREVTKMLDLVTEHCEKVPGLDVILINSSEVLDVNLYRQQLGP